MAYENGRQVNRYEKKLIGKRKQKNLVWWGWEVGKDSCKPWQDPEVSNLSVSLKKQTHKTNRARERELCRIDSVEVNSDAPLETGRTYHAKSEFAYGIW